MQKLFEIDNLRCSYDKDYQEGASRVVLEIEHLRIPRGKKIFIVGESGIGKSTILETLGMMNNTIVPSNLTHFVFFDDEGRELDLKGLWKKGDRALSDFRLKNYSFIFQSTNLMKNFTAFENIAFTRMHRMAQELSGGQQQRLAFARAILPDFTVLFGDEPTGNLDAENAVRVMDILNRKLGEHEGASAIIVSHDMHLAVTFADVIIKIRKCVRPKAHEDDEEISYGEIDEKCVYTCAEGIWTNGSDRYATSEFETFLRKK